MSQIDFISTIICLLSINFLIGCSSLISSISQDQRSYDFHKTSWGYTQAQVELSEIKQDSIVVLRTPETLVYKCRLGDVKSLRVYTFKNNRLRCAGYITKHPIKGKVDNRFHKLSLEKYGMPTYRKLNGDVWIQDNTVIYAKSYVSHIKAVVPIKQLVSTNIICTLNGMFYELDPGLPTQRTTHKNIISRWSSVWSYTNKDFYNQIKDVKFPTHELSISEQVLFGMIEKRYLLQLIPVF